MYQELVDKKQKLAVIGLGYVGLPIALEFAKKIKVIGFDINAERVQMMQNKIDPSKELESSAFDGCDIEMIRDKAIENKLSFTEKIKKRIWFETNYIFSLQMSAFHP